MPVGVGAAFMAGGEEASTAEVVAEVPCARAVEAGPAGGRIHRLLLVPERHALIARLLCGLGAGSLRDLATMVLLDPAVVSRAGISELEIPLRRRMAPAKANGAHLAAQREAVDLRRLNPAQDPLRTRAAGGIPLVQITRQAQPA
jgi:hypothetical protein